MTKSSFFTLLSAVFLLTSPKAKAQNPSDYYEDIPRTFYGGLIAGGNFSQVDGDNYAGYHKAGANVGGIVYAHLGEHLAASLEVLFSEKGARGHKVQEAPSRAFLIEKYNVQLNYAELPIQINYFDKRRSHFGGGFSVSRLINVKETATTNPPNKQPDFDLHPFRKMDYNFILGGSLHLVKGLFLQARFQYSLVSLRAKENIPRDFAGRTEQFNNLWNVRLMYLF